MSENTENAKIGGINQQRNQYRTLGGQRQPAEKQNNAPVLPLLPQNDNTVKPQNPNITKKRPKTKTEERDKLTLYLDRPQRNKIEDLRIAYRDATGTRLNEQEFMRLVIDRLDLRILL